MVWAQWTLLVLLAFVTACCFVIVSLTKDGDPRKLSGLKGMLNMILWLVLSYFAGAFSHILP